jgi:hypothetical protein
MKVAKLHCMWLPFEGDQKDVRKLLDKGRGADVTDFSGIYTKCGPCLYQKSSIKFIFRFLSIA